MAVAECECRAAGWAKTRRVAVARYQIQDRSSGQMLLAVPGYSYAVYVTSLRLPADQIRRLYLGRAQSENRIKELLQDFAVPGSAS